MLASLVFRLTFANVLFIERSPGLLYGRSDSSFILLNLLAHSDCITASQQGVGKNSHQDMDQLNVATSGNRPENQSNSFLTQLLCIKFEYVLISC